MTLVVVGIDTDLAGLEQSRSRFRHVTRTRNVRPLEHTSNSNAYSALTCYYQDQTCKYVTGYIPSLIGPTMQILPVRLKINIQCNISILNGQRIHQLLIVVCIPRIVR